MQSDIEYALLIYDEIEKAVRAAQCEMLGAVLPRQVQPFLPYERAEGSIRRDMVQMERQGRLVRVGGETARQGYRLPSRMERLCWNLNAGLWPVGTDMIDALPRRS